METFNGLLDAATVIRGDGTWTNGYEVEALSCGRVIAGTALCDPAVQPEPGMPGIGYKVRPFAVQAYQKMSTFCSPAELMQITADATEAGTEYVVASNFWNGDIENWDGADEGMYIADVDAMTVAPGANPNASVAAAIMAAYTAHPDIDLLVHVGVGAALSITESLFTTTMDVSFVVSPGYPTDGIAVTGPVIVRLGSIETLQSYNYHENREYMHGTRIAAVEFDPCLVVRVQA